MSSQSSISGIPEGIGARIRWTERHLGHLEEACDRVTGDDSYYSIERRVRSDGLRHEYRFRQRLPLPQDISLIIGDVVHNMRSVLDHAAVHAVREARPSLTANEEKKIQFVVSDTPSDFESQRAWRGDVMGDVLTRIEAFQPYMPPSNYWKWYLAYLRDLSNTDKHRRLNVVAHLLEELDLREWFEGNLPTVTHPTWWTGRLDNDTTILEIRLHSPSPEVDLRSAIRIGIGVGEPLPTNIQESMGLTAPKMLTSLLGYIVEKVLPGVLA